MAEKGLSITPETSVSEIVKDNFRTAAVFKKYGIEYCCGARWPLSTVCLMKGVDEAVLRAELEASRPNRPLTFSQPFAKWTTDFLIDYISHVHHAFLEERLPALEVELEEFVQKHGAKFQYLPPLQQQFGRLKLELLGHIRQEEEVIFPYVRQVAIAVEENDTMAALMVRTLRKPVTQVMLVEKELFNHSLDKIRRLSNQYTVPEKACTSHHVVLSGLEELDKDLVQHFFLESSILYPRVIELEKKALGDQ